MKVNRLKLDPELERKTYRPAYPIWTAIAFFATLAVGTVLAFLIFLRPTYSEGEKRQLAEFPAFSFEALVSGDYFDGIDRWFSDTFPLREQMVSANGYIQAAHGIHSAAVYTDSGDDFDDDEIPELSTSPTAPTTSTTPTTAPTTTEPPTEAPTTPPTTSTAPPTTPTTPAPNVVPTEPTTPPTSSQNPTVVQTLGSILVVGNTGYEYYSFSQAAADLYIGAVSRAADKLAGKANVYDLLIPLAMDITLDDATRASVKSADQKKAIDYIYGSLPGSVKKVDAYSALREHRNEYLYFRTDHHWTATGAYYAYTAFAQAKGITPLSLGDYETMEFPNYLGTLYNKTNKAAALAATPDTVVAYMPTHPTSLVFTDKNGKEQKWRVITDVSNWKPGSQYSTFIGGDNPFTVIHSEAKNDGSSCVVVKESFGNAFVPFLTSHYETIYVIDYRYYKGELTEFVTQNGVQDVLFINNMSASRSTKLMEMVDGLVAK